MSTAPRILAIVNADDLGGYTASDERIFDLMRRNAVTSATVIANGPNAKQALAEAKAYPEHSFGVHLNITQFTPLTDPSRLGRLLDAEGNFNATAIFQSRLTPSLTRHIRTEFEAQVAKVVAAGLRISHIDSHHHTHTIPSLFFTLKAIQRQFGIRRVRITRNLYGHRQSLSLRARKALWNGALRRIHATRTTALFSDLMTFIGVADQIRKSSTVELMVHPGNPAYIEEDQLLDTAWWNDLACTVKLINYDQI